MKAADPIPLAHISEDETRSQTLTDHLRGTAALAGQFASAFSAGAEGEFVGLLHDLGKDSPGFQHRLHGGPPVDHSTAGAQAALQQNDPCAAFAIAGHHSGIPDGGHRQDAPDEPTLFGRIKRQVPVAGGLPPITARPALPAWVAESKDNLTTAFFTRMLFSCLVDADFLDTETFMNGSPAPRGTGQSIPELLKKMKVKADSYLTGAASSPVGAQRNQVLQACLEQGRTGPRGIYTLTVPTGGGKTFASLAFALEHAAAHGLNRVIYVIPYTSIIDQTAQTFTDLLGEENVLAHFSTADYKMVEKDDLTPSQYRSLLASENWDAPVIVTTAVQFFESLYANRSSRCRKLHNLANSVLIFDEAQTLPCDYLRPCVSAIAQLVQHYGVTAVLCTATQPDLGGLFREFAPEQPLRELSPDPDLLYQVLRRVTLGDLGTVSYEALVGQLKEHEQVLCVVNRRKTAQALFAALPQDGSYCLTTLLCAADRRRQLAEIRARLENGLPCRVVSTSLIEAGVDVDFPSAYREQAGLDSLLQTAGRCNRNGKRPAGESPVWLFRLEDCPAPRMIRANVDALAYVQQHFARLDTPDAIRAYFKQLYANKASLDRHGILPAFQKGDSPGRFFPFAWAAEQFRLIESPTRTVYLPIGEGKALCEQLRRQGPTRTLLRRLGLYSVNCYEAQLKSLLAAGALEELPGGELLLANPGLYSAEIGLTMEIETGNGLFF